MARFIIKCPLCISERIGHIVTTSSGHDIANKDDRKSHSSYTQMIIKTLIYWIVYTLLKKREENKKRDMLTHYAYPHYKEIGNLCNSLL